MPENSLPAFEHALNLGVQFLELDVVISKDLQVVVSHEATFNPEICAPLEDSTWPNNLYQLTLQEIQQVDCGLQPHPRFPEQQRVATAKPSLREVFALAEQHYARTGKPVYYNIEIKSSADGDGVFHPEPGLFARLVVDEIVHSGAAQRCLVQSFDLRALQAVKALEPALPLAVLAEAHESPFAKVDALGFQPQVLSPDHTVVTPALIQAAHDRHLQVVPWTVNDPVRAQELKEWGVDGIITDYPDRI